MLTHDCRDTSSGRGEEREKGHGALLREHWGDVGRVGVAEGAMGEIRLLARTPGLRR